MSEPLHWLLILPLGLIPPTLAHLCVPPLQIANEGQSVGESSHDHTWPLPGFTAHLIQAPNLNLKKKKKTVGEGGENLASSRKPS